MVSAYSGQLTDAAGSSNSTLSLQTRLLNQAVLSDFRIVCPLSFSTPRGEIPPTNRTITFIVDPYAEEQNRPSNLDDYLDWL